MIHTLSRAEADTLAASMQGHHRRHWAAHAGVVAKAAEVFKWTTWPARRVPSRDYALSSGSEALLVAGFEDDSFNSTCFGVAQGRLHWLIAPGLGEAPGLVADVAAMLRSLVEKQPWDCVSLRLLGTDPTALALFQEAGFHLVTTNAWLYRWPLQTVPTFTLPRHVEIEWLNLRQGRCEEGLRHSMLKLAETSFFPDRFALDLHLDPALVRRRFLRIVANALDGEIADYGVVALLNGCPEAMLFFGVRSGGPSVSHPVAGSWLTFLARPHVRARGLGLPLLAQAIRNLPEGAANWSLTCALDHFASLEASRRLGFQIGAVVHDLHWWRPRRAKAGGNYAEGFSAR